MQKKNLDFVLGQANDTRQADPFGLAVRASVEVGTVVPSILRVKLKEAGYRIVDDKVKVSQYGFRTMGVLKRVLVFDGKDKLVAMGAAGDHGEALLHAALGYFREHPLEGAEVPKGITSKTQ